MSRVLIYGDKDYLTATSLQEAQIADGYATQDGRHVSPLTWKDGEYLFTVRWESGADDKDEGDEADRAFQAMAAKAVRLDLHDVVATLWERLAGKDETPVHHLAAAWATQPLADWSRPTLSPWQAEAIGKWLAIQLAHVMGRALAEGDSWR
jgi:hypothetical protein